GLSRQLCGVPPIEGTPLRPRLRHRRPPAADGPADRRRAAGQQVAGAVSDKSPLQAKKFTASATGSRRHASVAARGRAPAAPVDYTGCSPLPSGSRSGCRRLAFVPPLVPTRLLSPTRASMKRRDFVALTAAAALPAAFASSPPAADPRQAEAHLRAA